MLQYSFDADLRSVLQRLAAARPAGTSPAKGGNQQDSRAKLIPFRQGTQQPRLEIAHVALRRRSHQTRDAVP